MTPLALSFRLSVDGRFISFREWLKRFVALDLSKLKLGPPSVEAGVDKGCICSGWDNVVTHSNHVEFQCWE